HRDSDEEYPRGRVTNPASSATTSPMTIKMKLSSLSATALAAATSAAAAVLAFSQMPVASRVSYFSIVPATFYGFASSTLAYLGLAPGAFTTAAMTTLSWKNAIVSVPMSLLLGTVLGATHRRLASVLAANKSEAAPCRPLSSMAWRPRTATVGS